ncbi:MAG: hypothetical protein M5R37_05970 [Melioribacteraceae bacterium]|nr:hypothetical protein [Melioribacteraceae bacterium]
MNTIIQTDFDSFKKKKWGFLSEKEENGSLGLIMSFFSQPVGGRISH